MAHRLGGGENRFRSQWSLNGMDWRSAFIDQARSDFEIADLLARTEGVPRCHLLHYLQMSLEKLSKGMVMLPGEMIPPQRTHAGPSELIQFMSRSSPLTSEFHRTLRMNSIQRRAYLRGILPAIQLIERLAPALSAGPNAEYPWLTPTNSQAAESVIAPVHYPFGNIPEPVIIKVMDLMRTLLQSC